jgi:hypothetical protein
MKKALAWRKIDKQYWPEKWIYKHKEIPLSIEAGDGHYLLSDNYHHKLSNSSKHKTIAFGTAVDAVWIYGYTNIGVTPPAKKRMRKWCEDKGITCNHFIMVEKLPPTTTMRWLESSHVVKWEVIKAIPLPRIINASGRLRGSFDIYTEKGWAEEIPASEIDTTVPLYYYCGPSGDTYRYQQVLRACLDKFNLVIFRTNRLDKFLRDFPQAESVIGIQGRFRDQLMEWISVEERELLEIAQTVNRYHSPYKLLKAGRVDDPDVKRVAHLVKKSVPKYLTDMLSSLGNPSWDWKDPLDRYPLVAERGTDAIRSHPDHTYCYLNAAYHQGLTKTRTKGN